MAGQSDWQTLMELERQILAAVPPIDPPACHWLESDAGPSYCGKCAWEARWRELPTFGPAPEEPDWYNRNDFEELLASGISGAIGSESDRPENCETCGCTLDYLLTEFGQDEELCHFTDYPITPDTEISGETTYVLSRVFMNLDTPNADKRKVSEALKIARDALVAITNSVPIQDDSSDSVITERAE